MKDRTNVLLITIVIVCVGILFTLNVTDYYLDITPTRFITAAEVRGMAVEHDGELYTLNFDQQTRVVALFNQSVRIGTERILEADAPDLGYDKLVVYRFGKPDLAMTPLGLINSQLIYRLPEWNPDGIMRETGPGKLTYLLAKTYDP